MLKDNQFLKMTLRSIAFLSERLKLCDIYYAARRALLGPFAVILIYHRVSPVRPPWPSDVASPREFEREIAYLRKATEVIPLDRLVARLREGTTLSSRTVAITFDDGYKDNYQYAFPILKKYNVPATIFLTTDYVDNSELFWWYKLSWAIWNTDIEEFKINNFGRHYLRSTGDRLQAIRKVKAVLEKLAKNQRNLAMDELLKALRIRIPASLGEDLKLTWDEIIKMNRGGISFGAHTASHPVLTGLAPQEAKVEIIQSKKIIEEKLGRSINSFSFPKGAYNAGIIELLKENGFHYAVTTVPRTLMSYSDPYQLGRIPTGWKFETFKSSLCGAYSDMLTISSWIRGLI
jgi:peptidoglycan/xylan/chitin deacetylase (PgdA/CDA1 family)